MDAVAHGKKESIHIHMCDLLAQCQVVYHLAG